MYPGSRFAAGGALSQSERKIWRGGLEIIRKAHKAGADGNEVVAYLRSLETRFFGGETSEERE
jgi:hypothetical protein